MLLSCHQNAGQNQDIKIGNSCFENVAQFRYLGMTTLCVQDPLGLIFFSPLQYHLLASCGVKILEVSAVAVYNFKAQASLHHVF
jgi:hypothetical protein